jgi:hypothetical protein
MPTDLCSLRAGAAARAQALKEQCGHWTARRHWRGPLPCGFFAHLSCAYNACKRDLQPTPLPCLRGNSVFLRAGRRAHPPVCAGGQHEGPTTVTQTRPAPPHFAGDGPLPAAPASRLARRVHPLNSSLLPTGRGRARGASPAGRVRGFKRRDALAGARAVHASGRGLCNARELLWGGGPPPLAAAPAQVAREPPFRCRCLWVDGSTAPV